MSTRITGIKRSNNPITIWKIKVILPNSHRFVCMRGAHAYLNNSNPPQIANPNSIPM
jgi:hypothetical protein